MKVVVDTNIVFSAILNSQSRIGQILLCSDKSIRFYSPGFLQIEIQNHLEAYNLEIGLLINFGETSLNFKRLTNKKFKPENIPSQKSEES